MLLRGGFAFGGFLIGMGLLWLAAFAATFETSSPEWDAQAVGLAVIGLAVVASTSVAAIRPTKRNAAGRTDRLALEGHSPATGSIPLDIQSP